MFGSWDMQIKVAVGLPTNRGVKTLTASTLMEMVASCEHPMEIIVSTKGYNCAENRNWITAQAVKKGCSHLLLLDDDMVYEEGLIDKLVAHDKDIVGATYSVRRIVEEGVNPNVIKYFNEEDAEKLKGKDLFKCKALGGGLLLIKLDILDKIKKPLFWYKVLDTGAVSMSNDWWFCENAREAGFDVWCDPTMYLKHIGDREY